MKSIVAVFVGGVVGTGLRVAIDLAVPHLGAILAINLVGSFALGFLVARLWPAASAWLKAALGPGLLGSFTTFSAVTVGVMELYLRGEWMPALAYLAVTLLGGLAVAWLGLRAGAGRGSSTAVESAR